MKAEHKTILAVDAEAFSGKDDFHQVAARDGIYSSLRAAFDKSGLPWDDCYREDRGDGLFVLVPPEIPKNLFATPLPFELAAALREYNAMCPQEARIRLRVAVREGEIHRDPHGVAGSSINDTFRLLAADPLRKALAESPGNIALIASEWFYNEVIRQEPACAHRTYRRVRVVVKKTRTFGWICLPDHPYPPRAARRRRKVLAAAGVVIAMCGLFVLGQIAYDNVDQARRRVTPPTTTVTVQHPPSSGGAVKPPEPRPQPDGGQPEPPPGAPSTPRPVVLPPAPPPATISRAPSPPPPAATPAPAPAPSPGRLAGKAAPVQQERNVELSPVRGHESIEIDWLRSVHDSSGDVHMDTNGITAYLGAAFAVIEDSPEATRDGCAGVRDWVTRVDFSSLHVDSQLCVRSRQGRYGMFKVQALPTSPASNGRFFFFGRVWERS